MKHVIILTLALTWFELVPGNAQEKANAPDLDTVADGKAWKVFNATAEAVETDGKRAVRLKAKGDSANRTAGLALPVWVEFTTGVIELDLKGKNAKQGSFPGVAFNVADEKTFETVHFPPLASRYVSVGDFTNQHLALRLVPAPKSDPDPGLSSSMSPSEERGVAELDQPSLTSSAHLADPALTASTQGWRIGDAGVLNYTASNQRWRFVLGYAPDLGALRETFGDIQSFTLTWQCSLGKHKPASWVGVTTGSGHMRRPAPRQDRRQAWSGTEAE